MSYEVIEFLDIPEKNGLDAITVYWRNFAEGKGSVTIVSWGSAWTCYFGGMGDKTIQQFFCSAGADYLVNKLGITRWLKQSKQHENHVVRLVKAIQEEQRTVPAVLPTLMGGSHD